MQSTKRREVIISEQEAASWICDGMTISIRGLLNSKPSDGRHPHDHSQRGEEPHGDRSSLRGPRNGFVDRGGLREDRRSTAPTIPVRASRRSVRCFATPRNEVSLEVVELDEHMYYQGLRAAAALLPSLPVARRSWHRLCQGQHAAQGIRRPHHRRVAAGDPRPAHRRSLDLRRSRRSLRQRSACRHRVPRRPLASPSGRQDHRDSGQGHPERRGPRQPVSHLDRQRGWSLVRAPYGSHPYASPGHYLEDATHIRRVKTPLPPY